jgi:dolichol-phosphate mannosyltransferase
VKPLVSVITPIYNEKKTLEINIEKIRNALTDYSHEIIIVDDNSPDGSGEIADRLAEQHKEIKVLHRPKKLGLGTAYKDGFHLTRGELVVSIDSDLSHDPEYLPELITKSSDYDIVIGSRLIPGGKIVGRDFTRDFLSYFTNLVIRKLLRRRIYDWTSGYRVYRRSTWMAVMPKVHCDKWDFQFESLYKSLKMKQLVTEIPITFYERADGTSKFTTSDAFGFIDSFVRIILGLK